MTDGLHEALETKLSGHMSGEDTFRRSEKDLLLSNLEGAEVSPTSTSNMLQFHGDLLSGVSRVLADILWGSKSPQMTPWRQVLAHKAEREAKDNGACCLDMRSEEGAPRITSKDKLVKAWSSAKNLKDHLQLPKSQAAICLQQQLSNDAASGEGQKSSKPRRTIPRQMKQVGRILLGNHAEKDDSFRRNAQTDADYESTLPARVHGAFLSRPLCRIENQEDVMEEDLQNQLWSRARVMQPLSLPREGSDTR